MAVISPAMNPVSAQPSRWRLVMSVIFVLSFASLAWVWRGIYTPVSQNEIAFTLTIPAGTGVSAIVDQFNELGVVRSPFLFKAYVRLTGKADSLQAGTYTVAGNASVAIIVDQLSGGDVVDDEITVRIVEGWTSQEIEDYLIDLGFEADNFVELVQDLDEIPEAPAFLDGGRASNRGFEGYLFPDTYSVFRDTTTEDLVLLFTQTFAQRLGTDEIAALVKASDLDFYDALTLASVVEKEMQTPTDRRLGAGLFLERLSDGYPLQSDATVNYVTGKKTVQPTFSDVAVESPYNTYKNIGLPPTPISNPGVDAILAVLEPTLSNYYFFLHTPEGETIYSVNYEEHLQNKAIYLD